MTQSSIDQCNHLETFTTLFLSLHFYIPAGLTVFYITIWQLLFAHKSLFVQNDIIITMDQCTLKKLSKSSGNIYIFSLVIICLPPWCTVDNVTTQNLNSTWKNCEKMRKEIVQKSDSRPFFSLLKHCEGHWYLPQVEVNNGHFLGAMGYNVFFPREPLASMVFRWFCSPLTITINYFFNNWPLDSMVFQWFWGHSTIAI